MTTINEDYVSFETAKLLKEKGFDSPCMGRYSVRSREFHLDCTKMCNNGGLFECAAPTHQMAMKWLREIHKIDIDIISRLSLNADNDHNYSYVIKHQYDKYHYNTYTDGEYQYFEDAVEEAIKYVLENLN
jgi:hypothetical protein